MRDTIMMVAVLGAIAWGIAKFKQYEVFPSELVSTSQSEKARNHSHNLKGAKHEGTGKEYDLQTESGGSDEGRSGDVAEAEELTSIYSGKKSVSQGSVNNRQSRQGGEKVIHGVPINDYVNSHRNSLNLPAVTADINPGVRLYLWCMEVKKQGLEYTGKEQCEKLEGPRESNLMVKSFARNQQD